MTKNVLLSITGLHADVYEESENNESIEVISPALYYKNDGQHYIFFEEVSQNSRKVTKCRIIASDTSVEIRKTGEMNSNMFFEKNKRHVGFYETFVGTIQVGVFTKEIQIEEESSDIFIKLRYNLDVEMEATQVCAVQMHVQAKGRERQL